VFLHGCHRIAMMRTHRISLRPLGLCIMVGWCFVLSMAAVADAQSYQADLKGMASSLIAKLEATNQHSGTVLDFTNLDGTTTDLGRYLARELTDKLVESSKTMSFIDRANVDYLLRENKLSAEGLVNPETSRKLGNLIGVDTVITGTITPVGGQSVRLSVRAVSIETGRIITAQSVTLPTVLNPGQSSGPSGPPAASAHAAPAVVNRSVPTPVPAASQNGLVGIWEAQVPAVLNTNESHS
jgi:TolB-like protein